MLMNRLFSRTLLLRDDAPRDRARARRHARTVAGPRPEPRLPAAASSGHDTSLRESCGLLGRDLQLPLDLDEERAAASERVSVIAHDLETFSWSGSDEARGPVDVHRVLDSSLRFAWSEIRFRAQITKRYGDVPPLLGSEIHVTSDVLARGRPRESRLAGPSTRAAWCRPLFVRSAHCALRLPPLGRASLRALVCSYS